MTDHDAVKLLRRIPKLRHPPRPFEYQPLTHNDSIRLVRISSESPKVECEIKVVRLSDNPHYQALSYAWGDCAVKIGILCDSAPFDVSSNLHEGLRQLHHYSKDSGTDWFWIDQISINQGDGAEPTSQVRLMKDVYSKSEKTVISLPIDDRTAILSRSLLLELERCEFRIQVPSSTFPDRTDKRRPALQQLLKSSWFGRCWIVQEVALSRESPTMLWGKQEFQWHRFTRIVHWLHNNTSSADWLDGAHYVASILAIGAWEGAMDKPSKGTWDLQVLLHLMLHFNATDHRDRVFSLLGMAKETLHSEQWPVELTPDYARPTHSLFTDVTRYCILQSRSLFLLSQAYRSSKQDQGSRDQLFPSWVPRWDRPQQIGRDISVYSERVLYNGRRERKHMYNYASADRYVVVDIDTPSHVLRLRGLRVDVAEHCFTADERQPDYTAPERFRYDLMKLRELPQMLDECIRLTQGTPTSIIQQAFFLATTAGVSPDWNDTSREPERYSRDFFRDLTHHIAIPREEAYSVQAAVRTSLNTSTLMPMTNMLQNQKGAPGYSWYSVLSSVMIGRRLFITRTGRLGLGPAAMAPDDIIVILFGGHTPFVLRPLADGQCCYIGECYVNGIMKGEAMEGEAADEGNHEWFDLV